MKLSNLTQTQIIELFNNEDFLTSLYMLVRKYLHKHKWYSEDNVQECVTRIFCNISTFNSEHSQFTTWACTVCKNVIFMQIRKSKALKRQGEIISLNTLIEAGNKYVEFSELVPNLETIEDRDKKELLQYIYLNLSDMTKEYIDGATQQELANKYNISQAGVSRKIKEEFKKIRKELI